jgi:hypothetical protein
MGDDERFEDITGMQTRDAPGPQVRAAMRHSDIIEVIQAADLNPTERFAAVEYAETAIVHDTRGDLAGARYLHRASKEVPDIGNLCPTLERLAGAFIHPSLR